tara:strand:- start:13196 stop:14011 length:816 start_codon:yes stop_codon:yes gene_type:complete
LIAEGNIRKMRSALEKQVHYSLPLYDVLEPSMNVDINTLIGNEIKISFLNQINCVITGKSIKKTFGDGMSYDAYRNSPLAVESIIRPELSKIHLGIALRDKEWEMKHHNQPHVTYLSLTSGVKVGVTRDTQIPTRWIDQGAVQAIVIANTPYRQAAGLIEVALKGFVADKTNWRTMLKNDYDKSISLVDFKNKLAEHIPEKLKKFVATGNEVLNINYPVLKYPEKVKSMKLDKFPIIQKKLVGVKGQYLIFDDGHVMNLRSHSGYKIRIEA